MSFSAGVKNYEPKKPTFSVPKAQSMRGTSGRKSDGSNSESTDAKILVLSASSDRFATARVTGVVMSEKPVVFYPTISPYISGVKTDNLTDDQKTMVKEAELSEEYKKYVESIPKSEVFNRGSAITFSFKSDSDGFPEFGNIIIVRYTRANMKVDVIPKENTRKNVTYYTIGGFESRISTMYLSKESGEEKKIDLSTITSRKTLLHLIWTAMNNRGVALHLPYTMLEKLNSDDFESDDARSFYKHALNQYFDGTLSVSCLDSARHVVPFRTKSFDRPSEENHLQTSAIVGVSVDSTEGMYKKSYDATATERKVPLMFKAATRVVYRCGPGEVEIKDKDAFGSILAYNVGDFFNMKNPVAYTNIVTKSDLGNRLTASYITTCNAEDTINLSLINADQALFSLSSSFGNLFGSTAHTWASTGLPVSQYAAFCLAGINPFDYRKSDNPVVKVPMKDGATNKMIEVDLKLEGEIDKNAYVINLTETRGDYSFLENNNSYAYVVVIPFDTRTMNKYDQVKIEDHAKKVEELKADKLKRKEEKKKAAAEKGEEYESDDDDDNMEVDDDIEYENIEDLHLWNRGIIFDRAEMLKTKMNAFVKSVSKKGNDAKSKLNRKWNRPNATSSEEEINFYINQLKIGADLLEHMQVFAIRVSEVDFVEQFYANEYKIAAECRKLEEEFSQKKPSELPVNINSEIFARCGAIDRAMIPMSAQYVSWSGYARDLFNANSKFYANLLSDISKGNFSVHNNKKRKRDGDSGESDAVDMFGGIDDDDFSSIDMEKIERERQQLMDKQEQQSTATKQPPTDHTQDSSTDKMQAVNSMLEDSQEVDESTRNE